MVASVYCLFGLWLPQLYWCLDGGCLGLLVVSIMVALVVLMPWLAVALDYCWFRLLLPQLHWWFQLWLTRFIVGFGHGCLGCIDASLLLFQLIVASLHSWIILLPWLMVATLIMGIIHCFLGLLLAQFFQRVVTLVHDCVTIILCLNLWLPLFSCCLDISTLTVIIIGCVVTHSRLCIFLSLIFDDYSWLSWTLSVLVYCHID